MKEKQCVLFVTDHMHSYCLTPIASCCTKSLHIYIKFNLSSTVLNTPTSSCQQLQRSCHRKSPDLTVNERSPLAV